MNRAVALGAASALYVLAAWSVRPGFYDGPAAPNYAYVSPPPVVAPGNVAPTSGSGTIGPSGGTVATRDQPFAQASIAVPPGALPAPSAVVIVPSAPPPPAGVTLTGNVYCFNADRVMAPGSRATVTLLVPAYQPFPDAIYMNGTGGWISAGGSLDQASYMMSARVTAFGCFATGYRTPKPGQGLTIGGSLLPLVVALLIAVVVLAGLPLALRRRRG